MDHLARGIYGKPHQDEFSGRMGRLEVTAAIKQQLAQFGGVENWCIGREEECERLIRTHPDGIPWVYLGIGGP